MYRAQELIAHGGLASVHTATAPTGTIVALKKQHITKHVAHPMLRHEACAMEILKGHPSIPLVDAWARSQYYEYLTMQLLGPSIADLFTSGKLPGITMAARLAVQMVGLLYSLSCTGPLKPTRNSVDLLSMRASMRIAVKVSRLFHPIYTFCSHSAGSSRRDDMESLAYTFLEFALPVGTLPWHDIRKFTIIGLEKEAWTGAELAADIPPVFGNFLDYTRGLRFEEEPDYLRWRKAFSGVVSDPSLAGLATERAFEKRVVPHAVASSDSEDDYGVSAESDDNWYPVCSGPAPHGVAVRNLFGDEDTLIFKAASLMTDVPTMPSRDIYNNNEQLIPLVGTGAMDDHDEANCSRQISKVDCDGSSIPKF
ncbi:kinase-like domain-containing protein [Mycena pura]|uniref:Kinase-like domain-containing protein n=1 Tax=Mycena pura TaxID=153505 RepID=A0AAD6VA32_9AGAR|nr:kinase-like domain-containing protein [Mycena pura]